MFQVEDARPVAENIGGRDLIVPIEKYGIKLLSIGFLCRLTRPFVAGRYGKAMPWKQLIAMPIGGELVIFLIRPSSRNERHSLDKVVQTLLLLGAIVIIRTLQAVALADACKGINMFTANDM